MSRSHRFRFPTLMKPCCKDACNTAIVRSADQLIGRPNTLTVRPYALAARIGWEEFHQAGALGALVEE